MSLAFDILTDMIKATTGERWRDIGARWYLCRSDYEAVRAEMESWPARAGEAAAWSNQFGHPLRLGGFLLVPVDEAPVWPRQGVGA
ncbi:MAG: hypothetical protein KGL39_25280 [Patescibacteria group bacterium]|nr:hypothetical protein [Patescibacteria group bacterium]